MTFEEYATELSKVDPEGSNSDVDWTKVSQLWAELEEKAAHFVSSIAPGAFCTAQDWDRRIDCEIKLADGSVIAEMVGLEDLSEQRLRETGERLWRRAQGENIPLVDERAPPVLIRKL